MTSQRAPQHDEGTRDFALAPALRARLMGLALGAIGVILLVVALSVFAAGVPGAVLTVVVVLVVVAVFALGGALTRRWYVVRLDPHGYRVRFVRGAGATNARWVEVLDLSTATVAGSRCAQLRLRDGRVTTIPVDVIEGDSEDFIRVLGRYLGSA